MEVNRLTSRCSSHGAAEEHNYFMVPMVEHTAQVSREQASLFGLPKVSELVKGRASCHKTLLPSALCAARQLPGEWPTDVEGAPAPAH